LDVEQGERVEGELDRLIEKRHDHRVAEEGERAAEDLWQESVRRYHARQEQDHRAAWCEHYRKMRGVHWGLGDDYDRKLRALENGWTPNGNSSS
jgi:hypothetical protein